MGKLLKVTQLGFVWWLAELIFTCLCFRKPGMDGWPQTKASGTSCVQPDLPNPQSLSSACSSLSLQVTQGCSANGPRTGFHCQWICNVGMSFLLSSLQHSIDWWRNTSLSCLGHWQPLFLPTAGRKTCTEVQQHWLAASEVTVFSPYCIILHISLALWLWNTLF